MLFAFDRWVHVLIDPGAMLSFISSQLARVVNSQASDIGFDKLIQLPCGEIICAQWEIRNCPVYVEGVLMEAILIPFNCRVQSYSRDELVIQSRREYEF